MQPPLLEEERALKFIYFLTCFRLFLHRGANKQILMQVATKAKFAGDVVIKVS